MGGLHFFTTQTHSLISITMIHHSLEWIHYRILTYLPHVLSTHVLILASQNFLLMWVEN